MIEFDSDSTPVELAELLVQAILAGDSGVRRKVFAELDLQISDVACVDEKILSVVLAGLESGPVQRSNHSLDLILLIDYNRDILTEQQVEDVQLSFGEHYPYFCDPASLIKMLEILVDSSSEQNALKVLTKLCAQSRSSAQIIIPTGFIYLADSSSDISLIKKVRSIVDSIRCGKLDELCGEKNRALVRIDKRIQKLL